MSKRIKKLQSLTIFLSLGILPFFLHFSYDLFIGSKFEFENYYSEIYIVNAFIFAYAYSSFNKRLSVMCVQSLIFLMSTSLYLTKYLPSNLKLELIFRFLIVLTLLNLICTVFLAITDPENDADSARHGSSSGIYSENRYERYLLERIDEKLNLIKNTNSEKNKKEINEAKNSEELLNGSDILAEMLKNHIEIKEYFRISKNQSKFSFYFSIVSSVVGIIVVIIAASGIATFKGISIIAALCGAITEIISGIVLWIHNKSALQLNYYYDSLHENEKFLSAVNIADKLSEGKKEDMYIEIIRKQIDIQVKDKESKVSDMNRK